mmetsp:Transcript_29810/g.55240  ORF Transcript_29810/g.55240 Transcript_29810/m.55240 type:complete len:218 (-) Transcript_29810:57-710(-)
MGDCSLICSDSCSGSSISLEVEADADADADVDADVVVVSATVVPSSGSSLASSFVDLSFWSVVGFTSVLPFAGGSFLILLRLSKRKLLSLLVVGVVGTGVVALFTRLRRVFPGLLCLAGVVLLTCGLLARRGDPALGGPRRGDPVLWVALRIVERKELLGVAGVVVEPPGEEGREVVDLLRLRRRGEHTSLRGGDPARRTCSGLSMADGLGALFSSF